MERKRRWTAWLPAVMVLVILLVNLTACDVFYNPFGGESGPSNSDNQSGPAKPAQGQVPQVEGKSQNGEKPAAVEGTIRPTDVIKAMFLESDCPADFQGLDARYGPGSLSCRYHYDGNFGAINFEMEVLEYPKAEDYQRVFDSDTGYKLSAVETFKATQSSGKSPYKNYNLDIVQDDGTGVIYMETYDGYPNEGDPTVPLCGSGMGTVGVDGKFVVTVQVNEVCGYASTAGDYSRLITTLRDAALVAIARAEAGTTP
jgi:hypothetical protein